MAAVAVTAGISASKPLPRAFLCMIDDLPRQLSVAFGASAVWVVKDDGLAKGWGLAELHTAWNHGLVDPLGEELPGFIHHLLREIEAGVVHGEQHTFNSQAGV